jgi:ribosomal protein S27AE
MKRNITAKELSDLARITSVEQTVLTKMKSFLDVTKVRAALINDEYVREVNTHKYQKKQIIEALMRKYSVSRGFIEKIIYNKVTNKTHFCVRCASAMSKYKFVRNKGVCDNCIAKEINDKTNSDE